MLVGQTVLELFIKIIFNNSRTVWSNKILMPFLNFSDNLLADNQIIMLRRKTKQNKTKQRKKKKKHVCNFEIAHNTCSVSISSAIPLNVENRMPNAAVPE